jgi:fumarate hydratase class II
MASTRTESDSFGPIEVPADAYWGAQTERSIGNFPFGPREQMPLEIVHALGFVKQAAARVNARIGGLEPQLAEAIQQAAAKSLGATSTTNSLWSSGRPGQAPSRT